MHIYISSLVSYAAMDVDVDLSRIFGKVVLKTGSRSSLNTTLVLSKGKATNYKTWRQSATEVGRRRLKKMSVSFMNFSSVFINFLLHFLMGYPGYSIYEFEFKFSFSTSGCPVICSRQRHKCIPFFVCTIGIRHFVFRV